MLRTWPPSTARAALRRPAARLPYPLEQPGVRLFQQARQALAACVPALGLGPGDEALVPAYHHGSEIEALLGAGLCCRFYQGQPDLQPDPDELEQMLTPRTRVLHLIHYLGFPQDAARWRTWCDAHGLLLIEDAAQAWLVERDDRPVGSYGDLAVFCLYKSFGLPDGAAAVGRGPLPEPARRGRLGASDLVRPLLFEVRGRVLADAGPARYDQARDLAVPEHSRGAAASTRWLLARGVDQGAAEARRRAYTRLKEDLGHLVPLPFREVPEGASPFAFPVAVQDKAQALSALRAEGICALDLWARPHPSAPQGLAHSHVDRLRQTVVGLPTHQGLTDDGLRRIASVARHLPPATPRVGPARQPRPTQPARVDVSVLTPVLNEERHLPGVVERMRAQRFDGEVEFLFVDGGSSDGSLALLQGFAAADRRIRVLHNPARRTPQALNLGLREAQGEFIARMDAHTLYGPDYLQRGVDRLRCSDVVSVSGPQVAVGRGRWSRRVALALNTPLGVGGASFRRAPDGEIEVASGFTGLWRRDLLLRHGGWDEQWLNDQDTELAARLRAAGGRIVCLPEMAASYAPRESLPALARQYWRYGTFRVRTSLRHPATLRPSQLLPPGLALTVAAAAVGVPPLSTAARRALGIYGCALLLTSARASRQSSPRDAAALPAVYAVMHLAYGAGFLAACVRDGFPRVALAGLLRRS